MGRKWLAAGWNLVSPFTKELLPGTGKGKLSNKSLKYANNSPPGKHLH